MDIFRGYCLTHGKRCVEPFKGRSNFKTYDEISEYKEFCGILSKDTILLDFDDQVQANKAFKIVQDLGLGCRVHKTSRGLHIFFKNNGIRKNGTALRLACGLRADVKIGPNQYAILKQDNVERECIYDTLNYDELPNFFKPVDSTIEFLNMAEGEGRNNKLFAYILVLQRSGFTKDEAKYCIELINKYILDESLDESEMSVVCRDEAFDKPNFFKGKQFLFDQFATWLKNTANIVKIDDQLHIYSDGIYVKSNDMIESAMVEHIPNLNQAKRKEVLSYLNIIIRDNIEHSPANFIAFKNGVYDVLRDKLYPFSEKYVILNKINYNYNPSAYSELVDTTLNKMACDDPEIRSLLEEVVGYTFYRRNELGKAFILVGDGSSERGASNGKSTFLDMVTTMLGENNISAVDLAELDEKFKNASLFGKLANIGDDIADGYIPNSAMFKKFVTGERVEVQFKNENCFKFKNYAKLLFSANEIPKIKDRGGAIQRRLVIIPFLAHFSKNDPDFRPYIKYELREEDNIEYMIKIGVEGLKRVLENQQFTESDKVKIQMEEFEVNNNPILAFLNENPELQIENQTCSFVYSAYLDYCMGNNHKPMSKIAFSKDIVKRLNLESKPVHFDGKTQRVFVPKI